MVTTAVNAKPGFGSSYKKQLIIATAIFVLLVAIVFWAWHTFHNDAIDYGEPLNKALISGGAVKVCGGGAPVLGPDDFTPMYSTTYETSLTKPQAVDLITKVATDNGFKLTQGSPQNNPNITDNKYIDRYYLDYSSITSKRPWANDGPVELTFVIGNPSTADENTSFQLFSPGCDGQKDGYVTIKNDANHVSIGLKVKLPRNKW